MVQGFVVGNSQRGLERLNTKICLVKNTVPRSGEKSLHSKKNLSYRKMGIRYSGSAKSNEEEGYGPIGSLIRQGPVPFLVRITQPEKYERSVLAYMEKEQCSRMEAQGNMDAYFENPTTWAMQKLREKNGGPKYEYATANTNPKQLILTSTWASIVFALAYKIFVYGW
mmetsp:Transcript_3146/g.4370  ORF Transcript_3146/g.4370 Transcript_3146/m.4370 type:complete len:168 (-) Transcript_3146:213-716(-)